MLFGSFGFCWLNGFDFGWVFCVLGWCVVVCLFGFGFWVLVGLCFLFCVWILGLGWMGFDGVLFVWVFGGVVLVWFTWAGCWLVFFGLGVFGLVVLGLILFVLYMFGVWVWVDFVVCGL